MPKTPPPVLGFNNNVRHQGRIFHIQTEDSGVKRPHVITHLFGDGGRILKTARTNYSEHVGRSDIAQVVRQMMKDQHKAMFVALRKGELNSIIEEAFGPPLVVAPAPAPDLDSAPTSVPPLTSPDAGRPAAAAGSATEASPPPEHIIPPLTVPGPGATPAVAASATQSRGAPSTASAAAPPAAPRSVSSRPESSPAALAAPTANVPSVTPSQPRVAPAGPALESSRTLPLERVPTGSETRRPVAVPKPSVQPVAATRRPASAPPRIGTPAAGTPFVAHPSDSKPPVPISRPPSDPNAGRYSVVPEAEPAERYAVSRPAAIFGDAKPARSIFGDDEMVGEKSLDEVILSYLAEDLEQPPRK